MTIEDDVKFLERVPALRLIGRAGLRIVAIGAEQRYVHGGEVLFEKNTPADSGYVVQEGGFHVSNDLRVGAVGFNAGPGTLLAEMALMADTQYSMTATAITPSTVIRIPRSLFLRVLEGYPDAATRLRDYIAERGEQSEHDLSRIHALMSDNERGQ
jgi:CRP-like cAMP-binding protein